MYMYLLSTYVVHVVLSTCVHVYMYMYLLSIYVCIYFFQEILPFPYDLERIIDDWVLMGFLVGNDFIPHLPNMHIRQVVNDITYTH